MKNIAAKLVKIMGNCAYIYKDKENSFSNYKYASAANVLEKINQQCVENNICTTTKVELIEFRDKLAVVKLTLTIIDAESGETMEVVSLGSGSDNGDKAIAKAQTMAIKYAWMTTLNISTGDDPEADSSVDKKQAKTEKSPTSNQKSAANNKKKATEKKTTDDPLSEGQLKYIKTLFNKEPKWSEDDQKKWLFNKTGKEHCSKLTRTEASSVINDLNAKKNQKG